MKVATEPLLHLADARLSRSGPAARVEICLSPGQVLCVFGRRGSGKSELCRVIAGEMLPIIGRVWLGGEDVTRWPLWRRARHGLGYVPLTSSVLLDWTVLDNLKAFAGAARFAGSVTEVLERSGLSDLSGALARSLSPGQRRQLELSRVSLASPRCIVCDEPFVDLDGPEANAVAQTLRHFAEQGVAVLLTDSGSRAALLVADEGRLLVNGHIEAVVPLGGLIEIPDLLRRVAG